jgi:alkyldihydroxyacetonephosphate synthase
MNKNKRFEPNWFEGDLPPRSYRSIFKWGNPKEYKHPNYQLFKLMKKTFNMTDEDFKNPINLGLEEINFEIPSKLDKKHIMFFENLLGKENISTDTYIRASVVYGKTMYDILRLRNKILENLPDLVIYPSNKEQIYEIVKYCNENKINIYVFGGGSSVTRGVEPTKGGITIDTRKNFNKIIRLSELNQTVTVQPGISGPNLEKALNNAKNLFNTKHNYTCGHFPQSFEYSVVGGWVVTKGAGQNSTYYGKIEHLVIAQEYITTKGIIKTLEFPADATGPDIDQIMMGSEGTFGILTEVTLKIFRYMPQNRKYFSFIFKNWDDAKNALREIMQSESGYPSVCRLSDPEETDVALKLYKVEGTIIDKLMKIYGYKQGERCLFLGTSDGSKGYTKLVAKNVKKICKKYGAMNSTGFVAKIWEKDRFKDPYLREDLLDYGIIIDTLECSVNWENIETIHQKVREYIKSRPQTICMSHISHFYPQGGNLYFIFIGKFEMNEFVEFHAGILETIQKSGATMSHHHGIGKLFAPWFPKQIGQNQYEIYKVLKNYFDPNFIFNPGGTLGFDGYVQDLDKNLHKQ